jgi:hypothetical protein
VSILPFSFKTLLSSLRTHYMLSTPYQFSPVFPSHSFYLFILSLHLCSCVSVKRKLFKIFYLFYKRRSLPTLLGAGCDLDLHAGVILPPSPHPVCAWCPKEYLS